MVASLPWLVEVIERAPNHYPTVVDLLIDLWLLDENLAAAVAKQPWNMGQRQADGGYGSFRSYTRLLKDLHGLASTDAELARFAVSVPWFNDGLSYDESHSSAWAGRYLKQGHRVGKTGC